MNEAPPNEVPLSVEDIDDSAPDRLLAWIELVIAVALAAAALVIAIFTSALIGAGGIETAEDYLHLTPDFFPRLTMLILAGVCTRYAFGAARDVARSRQGDDRAFLARLRRAGFMVIVAVCYASTISWLGFILSTMLAAAITSYFLGLRRPLAFLPGVLIAPIAIRFVFERLLFIALPRSEIDVIAGIEDAVIGMLVKILL
ncbi:MAG: tripartite tricarboxylate transporter TctB family protein [Rhodospirillales bacterium]|nr:MAG: tripartite tricarboxylate transporter TctB family protein [Rhodospirillales bacterium]